MAGAIALIGVALLWLIPRLFGLVAALIFIPVASFQSWVLESNGAFPSYIRDRQTLIEKQHDLEQKLAETKDVQSALKVAKRENNILTDLSSDTDEKRIVAGVVSEPGALPDDVFLIDQGSTAGIKEGAPVYIGADQAVGFIARTYPRMSLVVLATSPGYKSVVYIYGPNIYTKAVGQGGGVLEVNVPQGIPLSVGDTVIIPSFASGVYGSISYVESRPAEPQQRGYVSVDIPLGSVRYVSVGQHPLASMSFEEAEGVVANVEQNILSVPVPDEVLIEGPASTTATTTASTTATSSSDGL